MDDSEQFLATWLKGRLSEHLTSLMCIEDNIRAGDYVKAGMDAVQLRWNLCHSLEHASPVFDRRS